MKRYQFLKYLVKQNCVLLREGSKHSWWMNPDKNQRSAVPRHNEISEQLARKICRDLGIPPIK